MKKYFYTVCCFLAATTFALTSCGDDETIIDEPDVPVTPENPDEEEPETPDVQEDQICVVFDLNHDASFLPAAGDSLAFFELVEEQCQFIQDSLTNAKSSLSVTVAEDYTITVSGVESQSEELKQVRNSLRSKIAAVGAEAQGFVYTGIVRMVEGSQIADGDWTYGSPFSFGIMIPVTEGTAWKTDAEDAVVHSISFAADLAQFETYINGDETVGYTFRQKGAEISLKAKDSNDLVYLFHFNETGTELTLVSINGEEVSETYVYTKETPAE